MKEEHRIGFVVGDGGSNIIIRFSNDGWPSPPRVGETIIASIRRARSVSHHRLYWGMLGAVVDATGRWKSKDELHRWVKFRLDLYDAAEFDGKIFLEWKSTDFTNMDQSEFKEFFDLAIAEIAMETGIDPVDLRKETHNQFRHHSR